MFITGNMGITPHGTEIIMVIILLCIRDLIVRNMSTGSAFKKYLAYTVHCTEFALL